MAKGSSEVPKQKQHNNSIYSHEHSSTHDCRAELSLFEQHPPSNKKLLMPIFLICNWWLSWEANHYCS